MNTLLKILLYTGVVFIDFSYGKAASYCPENWCSCDTYMDLNRANCSSQNLVNADIGMSKHVEILDLSNNFLTILDNNCFSDLKYLQTLNLSNNSIYSIDIDTFSKLKKMEHLILAKNRLESFDNRIIEKLNKLLSLDLSANKFMDLRNTNMLKSRSLEILDLHDSQITHLYASLFQRIPHLKSLNLSKNLLITINISPFLSLNRLRFVNLDGNNLICDHNMQTTLRWMQKRQINTQIKECSIKTESLFERMQLDASLDVNYSIAPSNTLNSTIETLWKFHKKTSVLEMELCPLNDTERACDLYESCMGNFSSFYKSKILKKSFTMLRDDHTTLSSIRNLPVAFGLGLGVGLLFGASFMFVITTMIQLCSNSKSKRLKRLNAIRNRNRSRGSNSCHCTITPIDTSPIDVIDQPITFSRQTHRQEMRAQQRQNQELVRSNSIPFLTRLFERPARRRHLYRSLNQNATNLVRRLSQSRLALNLSRHVANRTTTTPTTPRPPTPTASSNFVETPRLEQNTQQEPTVSNSISVSSVVNVSDDENDVMLNNCVESPRSETPPPAYRDIIDSKK